MTPWCVRDRNARHDRGPEQWGAPNAEGYFRDDNSIIKKLPLSLDISGPAGNSYVGGRVKRGFTACHIWRELPDGIGGADPWLYSFMPNLVWMPSSLSYLSDVHESPAQRILQATSLEIFRRVPVADGVADYVSYAWGRLPDPSSRDGALDASRLAYFEVTPKFVKARLRYLERVVSGAELVLEGKSIQRKLISSRYTAGLNTADPAILAELSSQLDQYRMRVADSLR